MSPDVTERVRRLHGLGKSDSEIAARVRLSRRTVSYCRGKLLLLPPNPPKRKSKLPRRQSEVNREAARRSGWPSDLRPREVAVMNVMADGGSRTGEQICDAIGLDWSDWRLRSARPGGSTLAFLVSRGMLSRVGRTVSDSGNRRTLYALAPGVKRRPPQGGGA